MATADDDTQTAPPPDAAPAATPDMLGQALQLAQQYGLMPQMPQRDTTPVSRSWTSLLGEALGGGPPVSGMTDAEKETAGHHALMNFGTGLMAASRYSPGQTIFSNLAQGFQGAQRGEIGSEQLALQQLGAQQGWAQQQAQNKVAAIQAALPFLRLQAAQGIPNPLAGNAPAGPNTSISAAANGTYESTINNHEGAGKDPNSSAVGGFLSGTWNDFAAANPDLFKGMSPAQILAARSNAALRDQATSWLAKQNAGTLTSAGVAPSGQSLGIAHYIGAGPAAKVMAAPDNAPVSGFVSDAAVKANPELGKMTVGQLKQRYAGVPDPGFLKPPTATAATTPPGTNLPVRPVPPSGKPAGAPAGPFGGGAFAGTSTVGPAPASTANAPVTTADVPPVPTPQMTAAVALAKKTGKPVPIAGTDGLFVNPNGNVGPGPGGGGLGKRADINNALLQGVQTAQTTLPAPSVAAAGPAAGGGLGVTTPGVPAPTAFGSAAFGPQTTTPPAQPAPQGATQADQPPAPPPVTTPPTGGPLTFEQFQAQHPIHIDPSTYAVTPPDLTAAIAAKNAAAQTLDLIHKGLSTADPNKATQAYTDAAQNVAKLQQEAQSKSLELQQAAQKNALDTQRQLYNDEMTRQQQAQLKAQELAQTVAENEKNRQAQIALETQKAQQAIKLEQAKGSTASEEKVMQGLDETFDSAKSAIDQINLTRTLSQSAGDPTFVQQLQKTHPDLVRWIANLGGLSDEQITNLGTAGAMDAAMNKLISMARTGSGFQRMTNLDVQILSSQAPQGTDPQQWREAKLAYLQTYLERQMQYVTSVHELRADGMPLQKARVQAQQQAGPVVPTVPSFTDQPGATASQQRAAWAQKNGVQPGTFVIAPNGQLVIAGRPVQQQQQPQQSPQSSLVPVN